MMIKIWEGVEQLGSLRKKMLRCSSHGDGRLAVEAIVNSPAGLVLDSQGVLYICERNENKIRRVESSRIALIIDFS